MSATSYLDAFDVSHDAAGGGAIHAGDVVRTGANLYPHYQVIAVSGETAWLRNVQTNADALIPLSRCRRIEA